MARSVVLDQKAGVQLTLGGAVTAALFRIGMGFLYFWAFLSSTFGIQYSNTSMSATGTTTYGWHFSYVTNAGWVTSGFKTSPTAGFVFSLHGGLAFIPQKLPGFDDFMWTFALAGLGIAPMLGIFMRIASWGGFVLNILVWFCVIPPALNPILDGEHMAFAFGILLLMFLRAGNY
jgi:thiosulfate dehydrogenase (quinone) large subunit